MMKNKVLKILMLDDHSLAKYKKINSMVYYTACVLCILFSGYLYFYTASVTKSLKSEMEYTVNEFKKCYENDKNINPEYIDAKESLLLRAPGILAFISKMASGLILIVGVTFGYQGYLYQRLGTLLTRD